MRAIEITESGSSRWKVKVTIILLERDIDYWSSLEAQARRLVDAQNIGLKALLNVSGSADVVTMSVGLDPSRRSPSIVVRQDNSIQICFPMAYFAWVDDVAIWMNRDAPYRETIQLCCKYPEVDHSKFFHYLWSNWLVFHEIGHAVCGHTKYVRKSILTEFEVFELTDGKSNTSALNLQKAMEVDADVWAAGMMFRSFGSMTRKKFWDDLYGVEDASAIAMQDVALILLPLFLEFDYCSPEISRTHPKAIHRLTIMLLYGQLAYLKAAGERGESGWSHFIGGFKKALERLAHIPGTMIHKSVPEPELAHHRQLLRDSGVQGRRLIPLTPDWLL